MKLALLIAGCWIAAAVVAVLALGQVIAYADRREAAAREDRRQDSARLSEPVS
jgi:uncharacterized membrane protein YdfJ with MMPL/SSD domain